MLPKNILFCTDFSENSLEARQTAIDFARAFGATLWIIHVVNSSQIGYPSLEEKTPIDIKTMMEDIRESVDRSLELVAEECRKQIQAAEVVSRIGIPAREIVDHAEQNGMDLIVMGTHGWTGFKKLILGSTAENVVRVSTVPVLTVKSTSKKQTQDT